MPSYTYNDKPNTCAANNIAYNCPMFDFFMAHGF